MKRTILLTVKARTVTKQDKLFIKKTAGAGFWVGKQHGSHKMHKEVAVLLIKFVLQLIKQMKQEKMILIKPERRGV